MIEANHVSRCFGQFKAVDDISFSIEKGEIVGLLGPNGAGKTTTMRMIAGFLEPSQGTVFVDGMDVTTHCVQVKERIGYMPESAPLYGDMIVADYLDYVARMRGVDPAVRLPQLAAECALSEVMHKNISDLSRGNRQRVGLAHALMGNPRILILDEPTGGLDPNQVAEVRSLIKELGKTRTVIVSTHILSEVEMLCGRVIIISGGKKVADAQTADLSGKYVHANTVCLTVSGAGQEALTQCLSGVPGALSCEVSEASGDEAVTGERLLCARVNVKYGNEIRSQLADAVFDNGWKLYSLELRKNSLEDVFKVLTKGGVV